MSGSLRQQVLMPYSMIFQGKTLDWGIEQDLMRLKMYLLINIGNCFNCLKRSETHWKDA